ncbi:hypothetical protein [Bacteroides heparinolyticus]|uniref:hypothetical protein n=1 Tax=Prevotella heparinolytica TaxID=28113 RepID=UPI0028E91CD1|nr:hypothetical protein [Bacteroides heparinolyticus]
MEQIPKAGLCRKISCRLEDVELSGGESALQNDEGGEEETSVNNGEVAYDIWVSWLYRPASACHKSI